MKNILDPKKHTSLLRFFLRVNHKEIPWIIWNIILYGLGILCITAFLYFFGKMIDTLDSSLLVNVFIRATISVLILEEIAFRSGHTLEIFIKTKIRSNIKKVLFELYRTRNISWSYYSFY